MCRRAAASAGGHPKTTREIATYAFTRHVYRGLLIERRHMQSVWRACSRFLEPAGKRGRERMWREKHPGEFLSVAKRRTAK